MKASWPYYGHNPGEAATQENGGKEVKACKGNCDGVCESQARKLLNVEIAKLEETLRFACEYTGFEGRPCPLCAYDNGVFVKHCEPHRQIEEMTQRFAHYDAMEVQYLDTIHKLELQNENLSASGKNVSCNTEWIHGLCDRLREALKVESEGEILGRVLELVRSKELETPPGLSVSSSDAQVKGVRTPYMYTPKAIESLEADLLQNSKRITDLLEGILNHQLLGDKNCGCCEETETDPEEVCIFHELLNAKK